MLPHRFRYGCAPRWWIAHHFVDHACARREALVQSLARIRVAPNRFAAIGGPDPERFPVEGDAARAIRFRIEGAENFSVLIRDQVRAIARPLIDHPEAIFRS